MISVLYVDDEPGLLELGKLFLENFKDFSVSTIGSASAALTLLKKEHFDVIISDYQMPGMDGLEFLKQVRLLHGQIPFILFTGRGREEVVILALNLGADFYLQKGGDPQPQFAELAHKVRQAVQRQQGEISLEESERRYRDVVETQTEFISRFKPDGTHVFANEAYCRHFKKRCEEIIGHRFVPSIPEEDQIQVRRHFASFAPEHPVADIEHRVIMPDGCIRWHWWNDHALFDDTGKVIEYQSVGKDITDRKRVEEELKQSENLYRTIFTTTGAATIIIAPDTTILLANKGWEELTGIPLSEQENKLSWTIFFDKEDAGRMTRYHYTRRNDPSLAPPVYESRLIDARKRVHTCFVYVEMIPGTKNSVASLVDITELKQAEDALKDSEEKFRALADNAPLSIGVIQDSRYVYVNEHTIKATGYSREDLYSLHFWELIHPDQRGKVIDDSRTWMRGDRAPWKNEIKYVTKTGETKWAISSTAEIRYGGKPAAIVTMIGITERRKAEEELRAAYEQLTIAEEALRAQYEALNDNQQRIQQSERDYRSIIFNMQDAFYRTDLQGNLVMVSPSFTKEFGYSGDTELLGKEFPDNFYVNPKDRDEFLRQLENFGEVKEHRITLRRKDGRTIVVSATSHFFYDETGKPAGVEGILRDMTDAVRAEEALLQANKKLSLLSGITRHDINNQLVVLNGFVGLLQRNIPDPSFNDYFSRITKASTQIAAMIRFTREYEKIGTESPVWQDLETVLNRAEKGIIPGQIAIRNDFLAGTEVFADPLIVRVFFNLLDNSLRHGERVTEIRVSSRLSGEDLVVVWEDNGVGIPAEDKERIFERGFGKNTGLGMFLVREILSLTGITIAETGDPGYGVRFEMVVPKGMWCEAGDKGT